MAPSQYDFNLVGRSNTIKRVSIYTTLPEYFWTHCCYSKLLHFVSVCLCSFLKRKLVPSASDLRTHIGIEGGSTGTTDTYQYICTLFRVPHELVNGVRK